MDRFWKFPFQMALLAIFAGAGVIGYAIAKHGVEFIETEAFTSQVTQLLKISGVVIVVAIGYSLISAVWFTLRKKIKASPPK
jgi:hypothetical protein